MEIMLKEKATAWRSRGKPRTPVPEQVIVLLRSTYKTGKVGLIPYDDTGFLDPDGLKLLSLLRIGAARQGKRLREQKSEGGIGFEMADKTKPKKAAK